MCESAEVRLGAAGAMVACCGLSMAIAVGLVTFSSTLLLGAAAAAIAVACVVFVVATGHRRDDQAADPELTSFEMQAGGASD